MENNKHLCRKDIKITWSNFIHNGLARGSLIDDFSRIQLVNCLKNMAPEEHSSQSLLLMADLLPESIELRTCLIELMNQTENSINDLNEKIAVAQSIYAEQFSGDIEAYNALEKSWSFLQLHENIHSEKLFNVLYALTCGWPNSNLVQSYLRNPEQPKVLLHIALILCSISGDNERAKQCIDAMIEEVLYGNHYFISLYIESLRRWSYSESAYNLLQEFLKESNFSYLVTALKLLNSSGRLKENVRLDMIECFNDQLNSNDVIIEGVDIFNGKVVSAAQVIADEFILMTS